jgi:hypothetical protein
LTSYIADVINLAFAYEYLAVIYEYNSLTPDEGCCIVLTQVVSDLSRLSVLTANRERKGAEWKQKLSVQKMT